ncbi:Zn-ribbon domain-containing OB-fold protein [Sphingosinicella sp.]|jgi:uncharacterized OB-fold protein|uniref:Zn-ribbon domain-containing OB-fold protein n=1 Tax=Sphingosinicella sp. TaxID=1917971 RepID=UPI0026165DCD|nr:Zn-ribbon domain-containing OB-fold protein [Sphingosinicella sp.]
MIETIPLPVTDNPVDAGFWRGCRDGKLLIQSCIDCGHAQHPPRAMCPVCRSTDLGWREACGTGHIWSFTVAHPPLLPAFAAIAPYAVALVELDDFPGIRMVGAMMQDGASALGGVDPATLSIGGPVRVGFVSMAEDVALPCWTPTNTALPKDRIS